MNRPWPCHKHEVMYGRVFPECPDCNPDDYLGDGPHAWKHVNSTANELFDVEGV